MLHADIQIVLDDHANIFFAMSESGDAFITGCFADEFLPTLDWVDPLSKDIDVAEIKTASDTFIHRMRAYTELSKRSRESISSSSMMRTMNSYEKKLRANGYFLNIYELGGVRGLGFSKNDQPMFKAGPTDHSLLNALHKKIYDLIVMDTSGGKNGLSRIKLTIDYECSAAEATADSVEIIYLDHFRSSVDYDRERLSMVCKQVLPFVTSMTNYMKKAEYDEGRVIRSNQWLNDDYDYKVTERANCAALDEDLGP